jgi:hypothetical protein
MRTKTFRAIGSITGLALLLGSSFVGPANAAIRIQDNGPMQVRNDPKAQYKVQPHISPKGLKRIADFIGTQITNDKFADLWRSESKSIRKNAGLRLDIQDRPKDGSANIQIQDGGGTFATVIIPIGYSKATGPQQAELMRNVRSALFNSARTTVGQGLGNNVRYTNPAGPRIFTLNGPFSN